MDKNELLQIKETYNNAGYFMLYVDEVNFDQKLLMLKIILKQMKL